MRLVCTKLAAELPFAELYLAKPRDAGLCETQVSMLWLDRESTGVSQIGKQTWKARKFTQACGSFYETYCEPAKSRGASFCETRVSMLWLNSTSAGASDGGQESWEVRKFTQASLCVARLYDT